MANLISLSRLPLLFLLIWLAYMPLGFAQIVAMLLLVLVFVMDAIDGSVARRRGEASPLGAMLDIAIDRVVELGMWFVLVDLGAAPLWAALVFIVRGALVDAMRAARLSDQGIAPFDAFDHPVARWLVRGRFMRGFYAAIKAVAFCWLLFFLPMPVLLADSAPGLWAAVSPIAHGIGQALVWLVVGVCLLRGLPDLFEYPRRIWAELQRRPGPVQ